MMEIDAEKVDEASTCRCAGFEETTHKAYEKIVELELEIENRKNENESLEAKIKKIKDEKTAMECELSSLFSRYCEIKRQLDHKEKTYADAAVDLVEDEDTLFCLMVENKTLEAEKEKAESDAEIWKRMVELLVSKLDDFAGPTNLNWWLNEFVKGSVDPEYLSAILAKLKRGTRVVNLADAAANCNTPGTPYSSSARDVCLESKKEDDWQTRKHLSFDDGKIPSRVTAPSTPAVAKTSLNVENIRDSDNEDEISDSEVSALDDQLIRKSRVSSASRKKVNCRNTVKESLSEHDHAEEADDGKDRIPRIATAKRKRAVNIVNSDSDSDDEDHVPSNKLKRMNIQESCSNLKRSADIQGVMTRSKRLLIAGRECEEKVSAKMICSNQTSENKNQRGISTIDDVEDSESEEDESGSEEQSSSSFIDDRSDPRANDSDENASTENENEADSNVEVDSGTNDSDDNASAEYEDDLDFNVELSEIVSKLQRSKGNKQKWIFQSDMLRAFVEDPEICMKAVCALYRRQTEDEKAFKETLVSNNRGFSKCDANRGCQMAEFLIDGDRLSDMKKTVQELQKYNSNGVKLCRTLAKRYSKLLFEIYSQGEDPFFNHVELGHK